MLFDENVKFTGTYRPYQQRVLDNLNSFLENEKIHVVAAPGSGKTTLGLELIIRLDKPSLILVPSIAIREQWIDRFSAGFLKDSNEKDKWISNDIKDQKPIICITYQALYAAYKNECNTENTDTDEDEIVDYDNFNLFETLFNYGIKTVCLDECHHLKSEWWKALESVIKKINNCSLIALTATPPYDASTIEWQRYIDLCGPIDEEIFVPELIKDNNICPHQDYIYYSYPTEEEEKAILKSYSNGLKIFSKYKNNEKLVNIVKKNKVYTDFEVYKKKYYENEEYYKALVLFLHSNKVKIPFLVKLLARIEPFSISHMEILLQNVLFDDQQSYEKEEMLTSLKKELSALGVVHNRKVCIVHDDRIDKKMFLSLSKLKSIKTIIKHEIDNFKEQTRCLVLTDYIKLKTKNYIANYSKEIDSFGTLPIFEYLRRERINDVKLCCLSGGVCIIPTSCKMYLDKDFSFNNLDDENYVEIIVNNSNKKKLVLAITDLFEKGMFNVLIGTKALLGEGWDSPCINTLILASFVGSYVLSNQMRGRAIRTNKLNSNKISNVWHLICLNPFDYRFSNDYYTLEKRCSTFVGIDIKEHNIENGIKRLSYKSIPRNRYEMEVANQKMLEDSKNKELVKKTWDDCIDRAINIEHLNRVTLIPTKRLKKEYSFYSALSSLILMLFIVFPNYGLLNNLLKTSIGKIGAYLISSIILFISIVSSIFWLIRIIRLFTSKNKLHFIGKALLKALMKKGLIKSGNCKIKTIYENRKTLSISLLNATTYEQNIFSDNIKELLGEINQPRYLLVKPANILFKEVYVVPDAFKKNKEFVSILKKEMSKLIGKIGIIFTKNESGKRAVFRSQILHHYRFKNITIDTKNIMLLKKKGK